MQLKNILWWIVFIATGVWVQHHIPGVDILAVGLLVSMQERRTAQTIWLALIFVLLQEGAGSLAFGTALIWYGGLAAAYSGGKWLFESQNMLFILLLGVVLGGLHVGLTLLFASLQDLEVDSMRLLMEGVLQAVITVPAWLTTRTLRRRFGGGGQQAL